MTTAIRGACAIASILALGVSASGCTNGSSESSRSTEDVAIATVDPGTPYTGDSVGATGTLVVEGGCLYLDSTDDGVRYLPVFPASVTAWEDGALVFDGTRFEVGHTVVVSGSEFESVPDGVTIPDVCDATHLRDANSVFPPESASPES